MNYESVKRDWLRILSPAVIAIAFSLIIIIGSLLLLNSSGGWSFIGVLIFGPVCVGLALLDALLKMFIKGKTWVIGLVELVTIVLILFFWLSKYGIRFANF